MKLTITTILICVAAGFKLVAQQPAESFWKVLNENDIRLSGKRQIIPQSYRCYRADATNLKSFLYSAPNEKKTLIQQSACILTLPSPNGQFLRYRVVESPVMAQELSSSFPEIKTFSIKGIDDPYATGKLDWTEFGFHAMVLSPDGDFFIDPYCINNSSDYISYYTSDFKKNPEDIIPEGDLNNEAKDLEHKSAATGHEVQQKPSAAAICVGANLKIYRLAVACTGQYAKAATGLTAPTIAQTLAKVVTTVNRVDGVYEKEVSVRLELVPNTTLTLYTMNNTTSSIVAAPSATAQPFTGNNNGTTLIGQSQNVITSLIGSANFDIGHTFSTGGGGLASLGCVCNNNLKAQGITGSGSPVGDPYDIDYVAHEMGHQFGGEHTFNCGTGSCSGNRNPATSVEPGSGVTIMAYAGICGNIDNLANNSIAYFHAISYDQIVNFTNSGAGNGCAVTLTTGNQPPVVNGSASYIIPISTPFILTGSASDPDGDPLTYSWEETDAGTSQSSWNAGNRPYFRSYTPLTIPVRYFPNQSVVSSGNYTLTRGEYLPSTAQTLNFRLTARDNKMGGGGVCYAATSIVVDIAGPLTVTHPSTLGIVWGITTQQSITWDVNGTSWAPISCDSVRIYISYNSGNTYSVLLNSTANDGYEQITVPTLSATTTTCKIKIESIGNIFYDIGNTDFTISTEIDDTGIEPVSLNNPVGLKVWPNPASERLQFSAGNLNANEITELLVTDLLGKKVISTTYKTKTRLNEELDVSNLIPGLYFITLSNAGNQAVYRFVKE